MLIERQIAQLDKLLDQTSVLQGEVKAGFSSFSAKIEATDGRLTRLESKVDKLEAKTSKMSEAIHRLIERSFWTNRYIWGFGVALLVAIIVQKIL